MLDWPHDVNIGNPTLLMSSNERPIIGQEVMLDSLEDSPPFTERVWS